MHNDIPTTSGATITAMGHSGRHRSCSMTIMTTIAKGKIVIKSSSPPIRSTSLRSSLEVRKNNGKYHKCPTPTLARNAAVQRRKRNGGVMSAAKALPCRNSR